MDQDPTLIAKKIAQIIHDKKGVNILLLEVKDICTLTDFFIIAEGLANRHVEAIADTLIDEMKLLGISPLHIEGKAEGDWVVLDFSTIIIHLFKPGLRELYSLEEVWQKGTLVALKLTD
jgi:ribosome-associated protein